MRPARTLTYGEHPSQVADLWLPEDAAPAPVVVLVHGGSFLPDIGRDVHERIAADYAARGWAALNVEYRRLRAGGGWPQTYEDVVGAWDALLADPAAAERVLPEQAVALGHSAGAPLALHLAFERPMAAVVAQGAVLDLRMAGPGTGVGELLGGERDEVPDVWTAANPAERGPLPCPALLVCGTEDDLTPPEAHELVARRWEAALELVDGEDHFAPQDPGSGCHARTLGWLERTVRAAG